MSTLADRVRWILKRRGLTQRELSEKAELSHSYLSAYFARAKADATASMRSPELTALAKAGNVSQHWLSTGEGSPEEGVDEETPFPTAPPDEGTMWARRIGWDAAVEQMDREHPGTPRKLIQQLAETRSAWAPNPMTAEWLWVQASHAMRALDPEAAYRLGMEEGERLIEERLRQQELTRAKAANDPPAEPALPGIPVASVEEPKREPKPKAPKKPATKKPPAAELPGMGKKR